MASINEHTVRTSANKLANSIGDKFKDHGRTSVAIVTGVDDFNSGFINAKLGSSGIRVICRTLDDIQVNDQVFVNKMSDDNVSLYIYAGFCQGSRGNAIVYQPVARR